jgi:hypothetical protein
MKCPRCEQVCYCWYPDKPGEIICGCCYSRDRDMKVPVCLTFSRDPRKRDDVWNTDGKE